MREGRDEARGRGNLDYETDFDEHCFTLEANGGNGSGLYINDDNTNQMIPNATLDVHRRLVACD
jgi:hypothetical protein